MIRRMPRLAIVARALFLGAGCYSASSLFLLGGIPVLQPPVPACNSRAAFEFNTNGATENWSAVNATTTVADGLLAGTAATSDPQLVRSGFSFPGSACSGVLLRVRAGGNGNMELFWGRSGDSGYKAERRITVPYNGSGAYRTLWISPQGHPQWNENTITSLRLDPPGGAGANFTIDWVRLLVFDYDGDGIPDVDEGAGDTDNDGLLNLEDVDSSNDGIPDAWSEAVDNAPGSIAFNFATDGQSEGWTPNASIEAAGPQAGVLTTTVQGNDPQLIRSGVHIQAGLLHGLVVRLATPQAGSLTLFWTHDAASGFSSTRSVTAPVNAAEDKFQTIYLNLRDQPEWVGALITSLRLDVDLPQGVPVQIDSIRTSDGDLDRDGMQDMNEGFADPDNDGLASFEDPDSDGDGVSDAEEIARGWNPREPNESATDTDGDRVSDAREIIAGCDPGNPADQPNLRIETTPSGLELTTSGRAGRGYSLLESNDLKQWTSSGGNVRLESDSELLWEVDDVGGGGRFFLTAIRGMLNPYGSFVENKPASGVGRSENAFLDNGRLRLGSGYANGSSINFLSANGGGNLINIHDQGRLIQQSYYAGSNLDRRGEGQSSSWSPWSWNPIQGGDASGKKSEVLRATVTQFGNGFFTRTVPLLWDMTTGEKAKAVMDQWNEFEPGMPNVVRVTCRFICQRAPDDAWGEPVNRHQELPAVYLVRSLSKAVTYNGSQPWTKGAVQQVTTGPPPWPRQNPTEHWVAMVNPTTDIGVALYSPAGAEFWYTGHTGSAPGGPTDSQTMHMAPIRVMRLERKSILCYRYWLIHGSLGEIRDAAYALHANHPAG